MDQSSESQCAGEDVRMKQLAHSMQHSRSATPAEMAWIEAGTFCMGSDEHYPEERPSHRVAVGGFFIDVSPVTNAQFGAFVDATGYVTVAEVPPDPKHYPGARPE